MTKLAFIDTETLGLDPDRHPVWEAALILTDTDKSESLYRGTWQIKLTEKQIADGDQVGMNICRFHERYGEGCMVDAASFVEVFADLTAEAHLVGAVVSFDEERLRRLCLAHGRVPKWHYHLIDVEALAFGYLHGRARMNAALAHPGSSAASPLPEVARALPWRSDDLSAAIGVETVPPGERHTAMADALWAKRIYDKVTGAHPPAQPEGGPL